MKSDRKAARWAEDVDRDIDGGRIDRRPLVKGDVVADDGEVARKTRDALAGGWQPVVRSAAAHAPF